MSTELIDVETKYILWQEGQGVHSFVCAFSEEDTLDKFTGIYSHENLPIRAIPVGDVPLYEKKVNTYYKRVN